MSECVITIKIKIWIPRDPCEGGVRAYTCGHGGMAFGVVRKKLDGRAMVESAVRRLEEIDRVSPSLPLDLTQLS